MSFWRTYYHLVWTTKRREHLIDSLIEPQLYNYLVRRAAELETYVYAANGWKDHVHLLAAIPPKLAVANLVKNLKGASAHFANHEFGMKGAFNWQRGYGVLTCGELQRPTVEAYINQQKQHHADATTNRWLEYAAEIDEGPKPPVDQPNAIHESPQLYDAPFI